MDNKDIVKKIEKLKKDKNAVIVAHYYQEGEVQEVADITGDSFALSKYCANSEYDIIVFCGVLFMAESANILSPQKKVLLPVKSAGCPMADMITGEQLREEKKKYDDLTVVCYINSTAEVKAESDICCTSSNAVKVVESVKTKNVLFVPDRNLGTYVKNKVKDKNVILWDGFCITHDRANIENLEKAKEIHPDAKVLVHPECRDGLVKKADFVGSTKQILNFAKEDEGKEYIIGTEKGILYQLKKDNPNKKFYILSEDFICLNMKKTKLIDVYNSLNEEKHEIVVDEKIRKKARSALDKMLEIQ